MTFLVPWIAAMPTLILTLPQPTTPAASQQPARGFLYKTLTLDDETYAYCVYVPPDYSTEQRWPLILALCGSGERGTDGFLQTDVGIGRAIRRRHQDIPAIVVMPQCRPETSWTGSMARLALRCVEVASQEYRIDPDRLYLTGLSLGGQGAWLIGAEAADHFAAIVPICGFVEWNEQSGLMERIAPILKNVPIWCFHGEKDDAVPVERSRDMVAALRRVGGKVKYTEYAGGGHAIWDRVYGDPELWKWLFAQKRAPR